MPSQSPQFQTSHTNVYFSTFVSWETSWGRWIKSCFLSLSLSVSWCRPACQIDSLWTYMCLTPASNTLCCCLMHLFSFLSQFKRSTCVHHYHNNLRCLPENKQSNPRWALHNKHEERGIKCECTLSPQGCGIADRWTLLWVSGNTKRRKLSKCLLTHPLFGFEVEENKLHCFLESNLKRVLSIQSKLSYSFQSFCWRQMVKGMKSWWGKPFPTFLFSPLKPKRKTFLLRKQKILFAIGGCRLSGDARWLKG